jgi:8-oxo-dGTP diphosphatase
MPTAPSPTPSDCLRVVAAAWLRNGSVLAGLRPANKVLGGHWELPGGKVEPGETDEGALQREIREELAADVVVGACFGEAFRGSGNSQVQLIAYVVTGAAEPVAMEHDALSWVEPMDWDALGWAPGDRVLIEALRRHLGAQAC